MDGGRLIDAVRTGSLDAVREALDAGGDPGARDGDDWSALDWAAGGGDAAVVQELLDRGADPFATGREQRRPYDIALAAGHVDAARLLRDAEQRTDPERAGDGAWEPYCRAYPVAALREFAGWREPGAEAVPDDGVVFVHPDLTVTASIWPGEDVLFADDSQAWAEFCHDRLEFAPPSDFDLLPDRPAGS